MTKNNIREEIWTKIKDLPIDLFALGEKPLQTQCDKIDVTENCLHFRLKTAAALPLIEEAVRKVKLADGKSLVIEQHKDFIVILPEVV